MKKAIIICVIIFLCFGGLFLVFFGNVKVKKNALDKKVYTYTESPFYKKTLHNNKTIIYLNIWASYSPFSIERYRELIKDKNKIVYNLSVDKDSAVIKKTIEKYGLQNDITFENYNYKEEILKNVYSDRYLSFGNFITISSYKTPMTFVFDKQMMKEKF